MSINGPNGLTVEIPDQVAAAWRSMFREELGPLMPCEMCGATDTCDGSDCIQISASSVDAA